MTKQVMLTHPWVLKSQKKTLQGVSIVLNTPTGVIRYPVHRASLSIWQKNNHTPIGDKIKKTLQGVSNVLFTPKEVFLEVLEVDYKYDKATHVHISKGVKELQGVSKMYRVVKSYIMWRSKCCSHSHGCWKAIKTTGCFKYVLHTHGCCTV